MNKTLVVIDMQNDFIDGSLGTPEAQAIVPKVVEKIKNWDGQIIFTFDTHWEDYLETKEGKKLPVIHCIDGTDGWKLNEDVREALDRDNVIGGRKYSFASQKICRWICDGGADYVEFVGLCTDICVIASVLALQSYDSDIDIAVDASCCAGTSPEMHEAALKVMQSCQIDILNWGN